MFAKVLDQIGGRLGLPNAWERRTKKAVLEAYDIITNPRGSPPILSASAWRYEPAALHEPTGWTIVFPRKPIERQLHWSEFTDGRLVLQAGALRQGVWLETRIFEPGPSNLVEVFEAQVSIIQDRLDDIEDLVRRPPADGGATPGELSLAFRRNGAPQCARMLTLGIGGYVVEIFYDVPARLSDTAHKLADEAVAIGLETIADASEHTEFDPVAFADLLRESGMSEDEIAEAVKEEMGRPLFDRP